MKPYTGVCGAIVLLLLAAFMPLRAQQLQGAHWFFGSHVGIDFSAGLPRFEAGGSTQRPNDIASSISSPDGKLRFYSSGEGTFAPNHQAISGIAGGGQVLFSADVFLAAEWPGRPNWYLHFASARRLFVEYLTYQPDSGTIRVIPDTVMLGQHYHLIPSPTLAPGAITAIAHANGTDTWIVAHTVGGNWFLAWQVTPQGISSTPVVSATGLLLDSASLYRNEYRKWARLKSSPDGTRLALMLTGTGTVQLLGFDPATGQVHTPRQAFSINRFPNASQQDTAVEGVSFSSSNRRLYVSSLKFTLPLWGELTQLDLALPDAQLWPARAVVVPGGQASRLVHGTQIAPDGRMYFVEDSVYRPDSLGFPDFTSMLSVINCPDEPAATCGVQSAVVAFPPEYLAWQPPVLNESLFRNAATLQIVVSDLRPCAGDTVRLVAVGGGTTGFAWGAAPGVPAGASGAVQTFVAGAGGTYTVTGTTSCGAPRTAQVTITPQPRPPVPAIQYAGGQISTSAAGPYQWLFNGVPIAGATSATYVPVSSGTYALLVGTGCPARSADLTVTVTGLADAAPNDSTLAVWPNPAADALLVRPAAASRVVLLDALGREVRRAWTAAGEVVRWETTGLAPGLYVVRAGDATRRVLVQP